MKAKSFGKNSDLSVGASKSTSPANRSGREMIKNRQQSFVSGLGAIKTHAVEQIDEAKEMDEIDLNTPQKVQ